MNYLQNMALGEFRNKKDESAITSNETARHIAASKKTLQAVNWSEAEAAIRKVYAGTKELQMHLSFLAKQKSFARGK